ncbi:MAG TPA: hypothetical protein VD838_21375, partial [Anaeromyxobacteraceae bacterium]|nr:hypothetical protein [Anaeromyxobacteraceae bacterium]
SSAPDVEPGMETVNPPKVAPGDAPPSGDPAALDRLREQVARHDAQIQTLNETSKKKRPWFLDIGPLISTVALLLSFSTTFYACRQAEAQKLHDARVELRGLLQRLSELPRQNAALIEQYDNPSVISQIAGHIQQENKLLAVQAAELMAQLERSSERSVTATEYTTVAMAMFNANLMHEGFALLLRSESAVRDAQDGAALYRMMGAARFQMGDVAGGRQDFERALNIFERFPAGSAYVQASTHAYTEAQWSMVEMGIGACVEARHHVTRALAYLAPYVDESVQNPLVDQIRQVEQRVALCGTRGQAQAQAQEQIILELGSLIAPLLARPDSSGP